MESVMTICRCFLEQDLPDERIENEEILRFKTNCKDATKFGIIETKLKTL